MKPRIHKDVYKAICATVKPHIPKISETCIFSVTKHGGVDVHHVDGDKTVALIAPFIREILQDRVSVETLLDVVSDVLACELVESKEFAAAVLELRMKGGPK